MCDSQRDAPGAREGDDLIAFGTVAHEGLLDVQPAGAALDRRNDHVAMFMRVTSAPADTQVSAVSS